MKLDGFGIAGYRSFGPDMVRIGDLAKVNVFIGKNNAGKSNILRFCEHLPVLMSNLSHNAQCSQFREPLDRWQAGATTATEVGFAVQIKRGPGATGHIYEKISEILPQSEVKLPDFNAGGSFWFDFRLDPKTGKITAIIESLGAQIQGAYGERETDKLAGKHLGYTGGSHEGRSRDLAEMAARFANVSFACRMIPAFRKVETGLIQRLRNTKSPKLDVYRQEKEKFQRIEDFLKELIGEKDAYLHIPAEVDEVCVSIRGKILPLDSLGTGTHELIMLAAEVTIVDDVVYCIEEPEIHLHPELQKKFITYIQKNTNNQYLIATHSNAFLDMQGVNVYHCRLENGRTVCQAAVSDTAKGSVLSDLGYKASDLLQTNCIIWVEGPTDRIYLNHWIRGKDPSLIEGLHYSIMFYGGRLLSHLALSSPDIDEFIALGRLNRNAAIVVDSDKEKPEDSLNETKNRVISEFKSEGGFTWVTEGREIENYVAEGVLADSVGSVHPGAELGPWNQFAKLSELREGGSIDKVAVAKKVAEHPADYCVLDIDDKISKLIGFIRKANSVGVEGTEAK